MTSDILSQPLSPHAASFLEAIEAQELASLTDDPRLTSLTDFATALFGAPISLVSIVESERQWFPARTGIDARQTPRDTSFCAYAMTGDEIMVVNDATRDPRFADNVLVTGAPHIRFYAGAPLRRADGSPLGALCVIDPEPREGLTDLQAKGLTCLAGSVMALLTEHRSTQSAERRMHEEEEKFRVLADTMPQMVWSTLPDGHHDYYNARWYDYTGVPVGSTDGEGWNDMFHPDDQARAWKVWRHALETGEPYEIEYRLRNAQGAYRWTLGRALPMRDEAGRIIRWFGTCTDIHDSKLLQEQREVVAHELSHRIKNIFAVIGGLISISTRHRPEFRAAADDLRERIVALGRAHDFVRPPTEEPYASVQQNSLHGLLIELLSPYQNAENARIRVSGETVEIDDRSATPLALLFHELATNASKYGALSTAAGTVDIVTQRDGDRVQIQWSEEGGPVTGTPSHEGFGSRLVELSVVRQLGGTIDRDWRPEGLRAHITIPRSALHRVLA
jgi:PAS domain S-box-containing protein